MVAAHGDRNDMFLKNGCQSVGNVLKRIFDITRGGFYITVVYTAAVFKYVYIQFWIVRLCKR